jgi:formylglycine-generating enzyme required for sulfatase activity
MRKLSFVVALFCPFIFLHGQNVSNVSFKIIGDRVVINYSLDKEADIYLYVSTNESDGWNTSFMNWGVYLTTAPALRAVNGDAGRGVSPGQNKQITWAYKEEVAPFFHRSENGITASFVKRSGDSSTSLLKSLQFKVEACPPTDEPELVWVDGCDGIGNFWIGKYPITVKEFARFISDTGYITQAERQGYAEIWNYEKNDWEKKSGITWRNSETGELRDPIDYALYPVVNVSFDDVCAYIKWLGNKYDKTYYLPNYLQWLETCYGLIPGSLYFGHWEQLDDDFAIERLGGNPNEIGWFMFNSSYKIHPKGRKRPNAFHIYDMRGNVYEWIATPCNQYSHELVLTNRQVEELEKKGDIKYYCGVGGSAFEPYDKPAKEIRYWDRSSTGCNVGFRVCMYPNKGVSWKNYVAKH